MIHQLNSTPSKNIGNNGDIATYKSNIYMKNLNKWIKITSNFIKNGPVHRNEVTIWDSPRKFKSNSNLKFTEQNGLNVDNKLTVTGDSSLKATSFNDNNITNVGDISLDSVSSDGGTSINLNSSIGIGIVSPTTTLDVEGTVSYKHTTFSTTGPTDDLDVSDTTVLEVYTISNNVTIGGLAGGVQGQVLYVVKTNTTNFITLEHNESGSTQAIFLTSGADERVVGYGGYTLYCNGTSWFSLSNPTGEADAG